MRQATRPGASDAHADEPIARALPGCAPRNARQLHRVLAPHPRCGADCDPANACRSQILRASAQCGWHGRGRPRRARRVRNGVRGVPQQGRTRPQSALPLAPGRVMHDREPNAPMRDRARGRFADSARFAHPRRSAPSAPCARCRRRRRSAAARAPHRVRPVPRSGRRRASRGCLTRRSRRPPCTSERTITNIAKCRVADCHV